MGSMQYEEGLYTDIKTFLKEKTCLVRGLN